MKPYYDDGQVTVFHADCREVLPGLDPAAVALVLTDPPYGVGERTDRQTRGRAAATGCYDFPPVYGDDEPFDPTPLLRFPRLILFGANYFAGQLPASPSWVVWDKRDGVPSNDNADAEMAWTNLGGPARVYRHLWNGMIKASERTQRRLHPTQKPVALMARLIAQHTRPGDLVLDPYAGSGPVVRAARDLGRRCIAVEIEQRYCATIVQRLAQQVLPLEAA
jgi:site-specific DNA-methyltransferase (adenine-specific)